MSTKKPSTVWLLTTIDNPYSPFTEFTQWYMEDLRLGYDTCGLIARMSGSADELNDEAELAVMSDIVSSNFSGKHIMVTETTFELSIKNSIV